MEPHILIVEDSPTQAEALSFLLKEHQYAVDLADSGERALAALRRRKADLVVTDVLMPGLDGYALCRAIKSDAKLKDIPVVPLTVLSSPGDVVKGLECGADSFVRKPFDDRYLLSRVSDLLASREIRRSERVDVGVQISLAGRRYTVTSERQQVLDLLISAYEEAVRLNENLLARQAEVERSQQSLDGLYSIALGLNGSTTEAQVAATALQRAMELPCVQAGWIVARDGDSFRVVAARDVPLALEAPGAWEGDCRCRRMLVSGALGRDPAVFECERLQRSAGDARGSRYHASVPLWIGDRTIGLMNLAGAEPGLFTGRDLKILHGVGNQVALALERARLVENLEQAVAERTAALRAEVAERQRAERAASAAESKFRSLVEQALVGICIILDGKLAYVNPRFTEIFGYDPGELCDPQPRRALDLVGEQDRALVTENIRKRLAGEVRDVHYAFRGLRKDGTRINVEVHGTVTEFDGKPAIISTVLDVTDRNRAAEATQRLMAILDATLDFVGIADPQLHPVYANPALRGLRPPGESIAEGHPMWARELVLNEGIPTAARDGVWIGETALLDAAGREIPVWQFLLAHRSPTGQVEFFSTIARDLSQRRRLEEQLRLAQKMEAVATLAGGVAHDFNNLLAAMKVNADLALADLTPVNPVREYLEDIAGAIDKAGVLTRQLLAFGRKQVLEPRVTDLNALLSDTARMLRRIIGEDIRLLMHQTAEAATVFADPGALEQVVMNLCVNARDAMPGGGELTILSDRVVIDEEFCTVHPWARPGTFVRLTISDTGIGMDAATQARIFEPFFTTKQHGRGTGLGLATVYGIVEQHNGLIHVDSGLGKGTSFKVYLPFRKEPAEARKPEDAPEPVGGTETILVAEDDDALRASSARLLERLGYRVIQTSDGREAIEILSSERGKQIQLAILDVVMPGLGGPAVMDRVRGVHPQVRFLLTTGYTLETSHVAASSPHTGTVLPKPYGFHQLAEAVRCALQAGLVS